MKNTVLESEPVSPTAPGRGLLPEHLTWLYDEEWAVWRSLVLRATGFAAERVLEMASPEVTAAAGDLVQAEQELEAANDAASQVVQTALDELRDQGQWECDAKRKPLLQAARLLNKGKLDKIKDILGEERVVAIRRAEERLADLRRSLDETYDKALESQSLALHALASDERFREAILWQNRGAFHTALEKIARRHPDKAKRNTQRRQHEELLASYLQRYTVKNDTIGFFGPVGWARFAEDESGVRTRPGAHLLAERNVYLEAWCLRELAEVLTQDEDVRPWLRPRATPGLHLEGAQVHFPDPGSTPLRLSAEELALLRRCDTRRRARDIVAELLGDPSLRLARESVAYALIERLRDHRVIELGFSIPLSPYAPQSLREQIEEIGDEPVRRRCRALLEELEAGRRRVADAAGDVVALDAALESLNATFTRLTRKSATRNRGGTYAGRTLVYEDCRRDVEMTVGADVLQSLGEPLSLVLQSARWYTFRMRQLLDGIARDIFADLVRTGGSPEVEVIDFIPRIRPYLRGDKRHVFKRPVNRAVRELWQEILRVDPGERRVHFTSEELRPRVAETFTAPGPGWQLAYYHSPDVMISTPSLHALNQGDYLLVLGEIHVGRNTVNSWVFMAQHPEKEKAFQEMELDLPGQSVTLEENVTPPQPTRIHPAHAFSDEVTVELVERLFSSPQPRTLPASDLVIVDSGPALRLQSRDGSWSCDLIDAFSLILSHRMVNNFKILGRSDHWPRVTIDRLVIQRETWTLGVDSADFADHENGADRFLAAKRWQRDHELPRFVFVKAPIEKKPFYVDFDSLIYVDLLAKTVRLMRKSDSAKRNLRVTEMLPGPDQGFLTDAEGQRYVCELRMVVTDQSRETSPAAASQRLSGDSSC